MKVVQLHSCSTRTFLRLALKSPLHLSRACRQGEIGLLQDKGSCCSGFLIFNLKLAYIGIFSVSLLSMFGHKLW